MSFNLPELPYSYDALEPAISRKTIEFHYGKHHQAYVNNLNKLTEGTDLAESTIEEIIKTSGGGVFNNAAQVWNHTFYWESIQSDKTEPQDKKFLQELNKTFADKDSFKKQFLAAAASLFGSGWVWLVLNNQGVLEIMQGPNAWNPLRENSVPLLTCDVWEHAYYLDYQNRRPDYTMTFWDLINWKKVEERFQEGSPLLNL